jgi:quinol monooxygenase YgiN
MILMTLDMVTAEHNRDGIIRTFRRFIGPTEARPGCLGCRLLQDISGEDRLLYLEAWEEESDLVRRIRSAQFMKVLAVMELSSEQPELSIQSISRTRGLEAIKSFRQTHPPHGEPKPGRRGVIDIQE